MSLSLSATTPKHRALCVEVEDLGDASGSGENFQDPNMTRSPKTNFEPKIGVSINYRPRKKKYSGRKARRAHGRTKKEILLW